MIYHIKNIEYYLSRYTDYSPQITTRFINYNVIHTISFLYINKQKPSGLYTTIEVDISDMAYCYCLLIMNNIVTDI